jgi:hypothetical protein
MVNSPEPRRKSLHHQSQKLSEELTLMQSEQLH